MKPFEVEGVAINCASVDEAVDNIIFETRRGGSFSVFTINLDHVVKLRKDFRFREAYKRARYILADGFPIVMAGRLLGRKLRRSCGSDLVLPLCRRANKERMKVFLFGASEETLAECVDVLKKENPALNIVGVHSPQRGFDPFSEAATKAIAKIRDLGPDICFVALGAPKQEMFADRCTQETRNTAFVCIGAGLDFISGKQRRAPAVFQSAGLEWLWRLATEPIRLGGRYMESAKIFPSVIVSALLESRKQYR